MFKEISVIVPSVRQLDNITLYKKNFESFGHHVDFIVIDEVDGEDRARNRKLLPEADFYGAAERHEWFKSRGLERFESVIPVKSHAETSFGLLEALHRGSKLLMFLDDDTRPIAEEDFLALHTFSYMSPVPTISSAADWVNVLEASSLYPRGFPYSQRHWTGLQFVEIPQYLPLVLHQGLWTRCLDLSAADILVMFNLDGTSDVKLAPGQTYTVAAKKYVTICSMNLSMLPEVVPAFYQLPMGELGVDRYDDIWSGVFLKRILDRIGRVMSFGAPVCIHEKQPRDVFKDLKAEHEGMIINEKLWKVVASLELTCMDYIGCYREIAEGLMKRSSEFSNSKYIELMCSKMLQWTDLIDKLK